MGHLRTLRGIEQLPPPRGSVTGEDVPCEQATEEHHSASDTSCEADERTVRQMKGRLAYHGKPYPSSNAAAKVWRKA